MSEDNFQFVDTNILIYAFDISTGEKYQKALTLVQNFWENEKFVALFGIQTRADPFKRQNQ